jgi:hypothetical protein
MSEGAKDTAVIAKGFNKKKKKSVGCLQTSYRVLNNPT